MVQCSVGENSIQHLYPFQQQAYKHAQFSSAPPSYTAATAFPTKFKIHDYSASLLKIFVENQLSLPSFIKFNNTYLQYSK